MVADSSLVELLEDKSPEGEHTFDISDLSDLSTQSPSKHLFQQKHHSTLISIYCTKIRLSRCLMWRRRSRIKDPGPRKSAARRWRRRRMIGKPRSRSWISPRSRVRQYALSQLSSRVCCALSLLVTSLFCPDDQAYVQIVQYHQQLHVCYRSTTT